MGKIKITVSNVSIKKSTISETEVRGSTVILYVHGISEKVRRITATFVYVLI